MLQKESRENNGSRPSPQNVGPDGFSGKFYNLRFFAGFFVVFHHRIGGWKVFRSIGAVNNQ
jgi:hypothetical protein